MTRPTLTQWSVCRLDLDAPFRAPELGVYGLSGVVTGHPRRADGTRVQTSRIVNVAGRTVTTEHTTYELVGDPNPAWLTWLEEHGYRYDPADPVRPKRAEVESWAEIWERHLEESER